MARKYNDLILRYYKKKGKFWDETIENKKEKMKRNQRQRRKMFCRNATKLGANQCRMADEILKS